jgi:hypothetical protein
MVQAGAGVQVNGEQPGRRGWLRRRPTADRASASAQLDALPADELATLPATDEELSDRLAAAWVLERQRLTQAAQPLLASLMSAEPQLERLELDHERGGALLSFANGTSLRAAAARSAHPALERLAARLGGDPVYLAAVRISAEGGVLLRLVCGAFWPMEIGPLVPAAG